MSSWFTEMMPDNLSELFLDTSLLGTGLIVATHYIKKAEDADELKAQITELMEEQKKTMSEREKDLMTKIKTRCLSDEALAYLKNIGEKNGE